MRVSLINLGRIVSAGQSPAKSNNTMDKPRITGNQQCKIVPEPVKIPMHAARSASGHDRFVVNQ